MWRYEYFHYRASVKVWFWVLPSISLFGGPHRWECGLGHGIWPLLDVCGCLWKCQQWFPGLWASPLTFEFCPLNVGVSWNKDIMRFVSLCGTQGSHVCFHSYVHGFLLRFGGWMWLECHNEVLQSICRLCQLCHMCGWVSHRFQVGELTVSVRFFTVFIGWFTFSSGHNVVWWHKVQGDRVLGSRDILSVMKTISCCHGVGFVACSKGV